MAKKTAKQNDLTGRWFRINGSELVIEGFRPSGRIILSGDEQCEGCGVAVVESGVKLTACFQGVECEGCGHSYNLKEG